MATQKYRDDSHRLLAQARAELDAGELRQASEKGWGAAALIIKAIAEQRGDWEHSRHRHFATAAARLRSEMGNRDIVRFFLSAESLHINFYEDHWPPSVISESLDDVERLLDLLDPLVRE